MSYVIIGKNKNNSKFEIRGKGAFEQELKGITCMVGNSIKSESLIINDINSGGKYNTYNKSDGTFTKVDIDGTNIRSIKNHTTIDNIVNLPVTC